MNSTTAQAVVADLLGQLTSKGALGLSMAQQYGPAEDTALDDESLVGIFQAFRPHGIPEGSVIDDYPGGQEFRLRFDRVLKAVGNFERADTMKDAYFIVRVPPPLPADQITTLAQRFVASLEHTGRRLLGQDELFNSGINLRLLEGKPPKHPRHLAEKCRLLLVLQRDLSEAMDRLFQQGSLGQQIGKALYFVACDSLLKEYLRWPLMAGDASSVEGGELFDTYFDLWRHGIKLRVFANDQIDFYLPRRESGELIQAGQFATRLSIKER